LVLLVDFLVWVLFWAPCVRLDDDKLLIVNPFRTVMIPWASISSATPGPLLTITTPGGLFKAWGVPGLSGAAAAPDVAQSFELNMYRATPDDSIGASSREGTGSQTPSVVAARQIERMRDIHGDDPVPAGRVEAHAQRWKLITVGALVVVTVAALLF